MVSEGELAAIRQIARQGFRAEICTMARANKQDLDAAIASEAQSVHLVVPTSELHIKYKLKSTPEDVLELAQECVEYAKSHGLIVELSAEDGSRSDLGYIVKLFRRGVEARADRVCLCDTVGILTPERSYAMFRRLREELPNVVISAHCHNDMGMAVANSISALRAGADQVHVTVNGIGERAGNAALEEVVVALKALYGVEVGVRTEMLYDVSQLVSRLTGVYLQPNKAIVGENAFTHESGIHTHGILSHPLTYEPIPPEMVGVRRKFVIGKHAGSHGIRAILEEMGLSPTEEQLREIMKRVKALGDKGKKVTSGDLQAIAEAVMGIPKNKPIRLKEIVVVTGDKVTPTASVTLVVRGKKVVESATGVGPVDAAINAIRRAVSEVEPIALEEYHVKAITGGTDAVVEVVTRVRRGNKVVTTMGAKGDIVMASVDAILSAINLLLSENSSAHSG